MARKQYTVVTVSRQMTLNMSERPIYKYKKDNRNKNMKPNQTTISSQLICVLWCFIFLFLHLFSEGVYKRIYIIMMNSLLIISIPRMHVEHMFMLSIQ